ncbi:uncharacterized protein CANTADRAFT_4870 [Suhomyces tanzawaensis NRRL Y-17324]|uniref:PQ-loop-domain-containing protein n=1 Tax=Suhomyces tanzawaensis NRRL Y-17324 TaxID=984487 RepID=A0A1E4SN02_9ASCO|nr:uncharacterized protein CANTADRAFT_4870 [Suhomyces tanzawaensis NRRL Y-17324]ODV80875.1 hypothetical protein CANTADRAFT_4870 [Suhomyces tanzawaensis NRRL Y-17324]
MSSLVPDEYLAYLAYLPDLQVCANIFMTFTPMFSYGSTCYSIYRRQTSTGFSIDICVTMLMAATLRILYYVIAPYEITLLRQSVVMIFIQCILLKVSLHYRPNNYDPDFLSPMPMFRNEINSSLPRRLSASGNAVDHGNYYANKSLISSLGFLAADGFKIVRIYLQVSFSQALKFFDVYYQRPFFFWQWKNEAPYWSFVAKFSGVFAFLTLVFRNNQTYGNFIGVLGLFIESLLPLPQILLLNRLGSVKNFKIILLLSWLGGDLTKISYLVLGTDNVSPIFIIAGLFQMSLDLFIAWQYLHFRYLEMKATRFASTSLSSGSFPSTVSSGNASLADSTNMNEIVDQLLASPSNKNQNPSLETSAKVQPDQSIELKSFNLV